MYMSDEQIRKGKTCHAQQATAMRNINEVILSGNTVGTLATRTYNGTPYADLIVASNRKAYQDETGKWVSGVDYVPVSLSNRMAERVSDLPKGSEIVLRGYVESFSYQKDDKTVRAVRVHASEVISVMPKRPATEKKTVVIDSSDLPF